MKFAFLYIGIWLSLALSTYGQSPSPEDSLREYYIRYPQQALKEAQHMQRQAVQEKNTPLLLKALILQSATQIRLNAEAYPQVIDTLQSYLVQEQNPVAQSILHSYLGELYLSYFKANQYIISQRAELQDDEPAEITVWSSNLFRQKIFHHFLSSLAPAHILQVTPISGYQLILIQGSASDSLRPTVYDFLAYRAIDFLQELPSQNSTTFNALTPLTQFLQDSIPSIPLNTTSQVLKIYQDLLRFRQQTGQAAPLLMADLTRIQYAYFISQEPQKDTLYLERLNQLEKRFIKEPIVVEVMAQRAEAYLNLLPPTSNTYSFWEEQSQKALEICKAGIGRFPKYPRINLLYRLRNTIQEPRLSIEFPRNIYPGDSLPVNIRWANVEKLKISIYQVPLTTSQYLTADSSFIRTHRTLLSEHIYQLPSTLAKRDTTISVPSIGKAGLYQIVLQAPKAKKRIVSYFIATRIFTAYENFSDKSYFMVRDWKSGKPVKNASLLLYSSNKNTHPIDTLYSDAHGIAQLTISPETPRMLLYEVVNSENPNGSYTSFSTRSYQTPTSENQVELITDRKIYRPGQTVYFKGIAWQQSPSQFHLLPSRRYEIVFRNSQGKEIAKQTLRTNSFGSFSGSFVIPAKTLNGDFSIKAGSSVTFISVAEYKRPTFEIVFSDPRQNFHSGDMIRLQGKAVSFSGVPLANTTINYQIQRYLPFFFRFQSAQNITGTTETNEQGEFDIQFQAEAPSSHTYPSYFYKISASATASNGESQSGDYVLPIQGNKIIPVLEIPEQVNKNIATAFHISYDGADSVSQQIIYSISKLFIPSDFLQTGEFQDTLVEKQVILDTIIFSQSDSIFPPLKEQASGAYLFSATINGTTSNKIFYLYSPQDQRPPVPTYAWSAKLKTQCKIGETAQVLFGTSVKDAYIMYELYSPKGLIRRTFTILSDKVLSIEIPYSSQQGMQVNLNIYYVKDKQAFQESIPITWSREQNIEIRTTVFRDHLQPGQQEQWELRVTHPSGKGAKAEVLAMMYDAALDHIIPYNLHFSPSYLRTYFSSEWNTSIPSSQYFSFFYPSVLRKKYPIPSFRFDQLNTFSSNVSFYNPQAAFTGSVAYAQKNGLRLRGTGVAKPEAATDEALMDAGMPVTQVSAYRQNFQETAFFYPQLQTDSSGEVRFRFTLPESNTRWKFTALAYTQQLAVGELTRYVTTSRSLMVRPNLPRFLRSGDQAEIKVLISNLSDTLQQGVASLSLSGYPATTPWFTDSAAFSIPAQANQTVSFHFQVPQDKDITLCRIFAGSKQYTDGEQHLLPILPDRILLTASQPFYTSESGQHRFSLKPSAASQENYRLTLEATANPVWYAILALPALTEPKNENITDLSAAYYVNAVAAFIARSNPVILQALRTWRNQPSDHAALQSPLEQNEELKNILLETTPWALEAQNETERLHTLEQLFDPNRLQYAQTQILDKLSALQHSDGSWSWFKNMPSSRVMTMNMLTVMQKTVLSAQQEAGEQEKSMQLKALRWLDQEMIKEFQQKEKSAQPTYEQLLYLYTRSFYPDIPLGDALEAHKYFLSLIAQKWTDFSLYEKAIAATALYRYGQHTAAREILTSIRQYAATSADKGMYWPNNRPVASRNSPLQVHTALMEAFYESEGSSADLKQMGQWLLRQKQTQTWSSVPSTVDAIYALLQIYEKPLSQPGELTIEWGKEKIHPLDSLPFLGYYQQSLPAAQIHPDLLSVQVHSSESSPVWGALYLQYFDKLNCIKASGNTLEVDKKLFVEQQTAQGKQLYAVSSVPALHPGDKVIVRLTFTLDQDMSYLHLQDLRAACFEPVQQRSGTRWKFGSVYYEETKDAVTNLFFDFLSRGTYVIEYPVWVNQSGTYQDGIATFQSVYAPEFRAYSGTSQIQVK